VRVGGHVRGACPSPRALRRRRDDLQREKLLVGREPGGGDGGDDMVIAHPVGVDRGRDLREHRSSLLRADFGDECDEQDPLPLLRQLLGPGRGVPADQVQAALDPAGAGGLATSARARRRAPRPAGRRRDLEGVGLQVSYKPIEEKKRNPARHEYAAMLNEGEYYFVGERLTTALVNAAEVASDFDREVRLYHTFPSPGPVRRFVGKVMPDGTFHDGRR